MDRTTIIFVTHSTGGIIARYTLVEKASDFSNKKVGLVLIASPSMGSKQADKFKHIARAYNQKLGEQLQHNSDFLVELDRRFKALKEGRRIAQLRGIEMIENHFIVHHWLFPDRQLVVDERSGARYFGDFKRLASQDHFSAVKPINVKHPAHKYLAGFTEDILAEETAEHSENNLSHRIWIRKDSAFEISEIGQKKYLLRKVGMENNVQRQIAVSELNIDVTNARTDRPISINSIRFGLSDVLTNSSGSQSVGVKFKQGANSLDVTAVIERFGLSLLSQGGAVQLFKVTGDRSPSTVVKRLRKLTPLVDYAFVERSGRPHREFEVSPAVGVSLDPSNLFYEFQVGRSVSIGESLTVPVKLGFNELLYGKLEISIVVDSSTVLPVEEIDFDVRMSQPLTAN